METEQIREWERYWREASGAKQYAHIPPEACAQTADAFKAWADEQDSQQSAKRPGAQHMMRVDEMPAPYGDCFQGECHHAKPHTR